MNEFSDELFPNFFGDLEPIDFSTTSFISRNDCGSLGLTGHHTSATTGSSSSSLNSDDHNYNMAASPTSSDDSGLSSDGPNTPPTNSDHFFKDTVGGEITSPIYIKQEPESPVMDCDAFMHEFSSGDETSDRWGCIKEEVNLDDLPALSALNNPSSILEDEMAADFLTQELMTTPIPASKSSKHEHSPVSISMTGLGEYFQLSTSSTVMSVCLFILLFSVPSPTRPQIMTMMTKS